MDGHNTDNAYIVYALLFNRKRMKTYNVAK